MISELKNYHAGKPCYILATGPSLAETDLVPLKNEIVIGMNSSYKILRSELHIFATNEPEAPDDRAFLENVPDGTLCFNLELPHEAARHKDCIYLSWLGGQGWSDDLTLGVFAAATVAHPALQLAVWLGCNPITFIGLDLKNEGLHDDIDFVSMNDTLTQCVILLKSRGIDVYNASPYYAYKSIPPVPDGLPFCRSRETAKGII
jgi:hypothetical protein